MFQFLKVGDKYWLVGEGSNSVVQWYVSTSSPYKIYAGQVDIASGFSSQSEAQAALDVAVKSLGKVTEVEVV
jgi:hypothetical protein